MNGPISGSSLHLILDTVQWSSLFQVSPEIRRNTFKHKALKKINVAFIETMYIVCCVCIKMAMTTSQVATRTIVSRKKHLCFPLVPHSPDSHCKSFSVDKFILPIIKSYKLTQQAPPWRTPLKTSLAAVLTSIKTVVLQPPFDTYFWAKEISALNLHLFHSSSSSSSLLTLGTSLSKSSIWLGMLSSSMRASFMIATRREVGKAISGWGWQAGQSTKIFIITVSLKSFSAWNCFPFIFQY